MWDYSSWTDNDLVRAIEVDAACRDEYLTELAARYKARDELAAKTSALEAEIRERMNG